MVKRILGVMFTAVMLAAFIPCVYAAESVGSGECGVQGSNVTWTLDADGVLTISGEGEMEGYQIIDEYRVVKERPRPWGEDAVTKVIIEDGVTKIGSSAFSNCRNLTEAVIAESVTYIDHCAFDFDTKLASVNIPDNVTYIGDTAFGFCAFESIVLPDSLNALGWGAFYMCTELQNINIPASVDFLPEDTFDYCRSLISINVDEDNKNYKSVDGILFNKEETELLIYPPNRDNTEYIIPDTVTDIAEDTFAWCSNLVSLTIHSGVERIDEWFIYDAPKLEEINVDEKNKNYCSVDGILFNKNKTELIRYPSNKSGELYKIPDSVINIYSCAFDMAANLKSVIIPAGVKQIGTSAFWECTELLDISIPFTVSFIDRMAFSGCESLSDIYYYGTKEQWDSIEIHNNDIEELNNTEIHIVPTRITDVNAVENEIGKYNIDVKFENAPAFSQLIVVLYSNGVAEGLKSVEINENIIGSASKTINIGSENVDSAKVFIWNSISAMIPLCESKDIIL